MPNDWTVEVALGAITEEFEATVRHLDDDGTGLRVPFHGDFAGSKQMPSLGSRIRWWARQLRCALDRSESERAALRSEVARLRAVVEAADRLVASDTGDVERVAAVLAYRRKRAALDAKEGA